MSRGSAQSVHASRYLVVRFLILALRSSVFFSALSSSLSAAGWCSSPSSRFGGQRRRRLGGVLRRRAAAAGILARCASIRPAASGIGLESRGRSLLFELIGRPRPCGSAGDPCGCARPARRSRRSIRSRNRVASGTQPIEAHRARGGRTRRRRTRQLAASTSSGQISWLLVALGRSWRNVLISQQLCQPVRSVATRAARRSPCPACRPWAPVLASRGQQRVVGLASRNSSEYGTFTPVRIGAAAGPGLSITK